MLDFLEEERIAFWIGSLIYGVAFVFALSSLMRGHRYARSILLILVVSGFAFQTLGLYLRGLETRSCPLGNPFEIIQFITWSLILLYLLIGPAFRMSLLGFFSAGMAAGLGIVSLLIAQWDRPSSARIWGENAWIEAHAAMAIFSYGVFGTLALTSLMYLIQNYGLKHKRFQGLFSILPSLVQLDQMNTRLLITGVIVLSCSLGIGVFYWFGDLEQVKSPKLLFTLILWGAYCLLLILHKTNRLIAKKFAWGCLLLFIFALLSLGPVDASRQSQREEIEQQP